MPRQDFSDSTIMPGTGSNWLNDGVGPLMPPQLTFLASFCEAVVESKYAMVA